MISLYNDSSKLQISRAKYISVYEGELIKHMCVNLLHRDMIKRSDGCLDLKKKYPNDFNNYNTLYGAVRAAIKNGITESNIQEVALSKLTGDVKFSVTEAIDYLKNIDALNETEISSYLYLDDFVDTENNKHQTNQSASFPGILMATKQAKGITYVPGSKLNIKEIDTQIKVDTEDGKKSSIQIVSEASEAKVNIENIKLNWRAIVKFVGRAFETVIQRIKTTDINTDDMDRYFIGFISYCWLKDKSIAAVKANDDPAYAGYFKYIEGIKNRNKIRELFSNVLVREDALPTAFIDTCEKFITRNNNVGLRSSSVDIESGIEAVKENVTYEYEGIGDWGKVNYMKLKTWGEIMRDFYWLLTIVIPREVSLKSDGRTALIPKIFDLASDVKGVFELLGLSRINSVVPDTMQLTNYIKANMFETKYYSSILGDDIYDWFNIDGHIDTTNIRDLYPMQDYIYVLSDKQINHNIAPNASETNNLCNLGRFASIFYIDKEESEREAKRQQKSSIEQVKTTSVLDDIRILKFLDLISEDDNDSKYLSELVGHHRKYIEQCIRTQRSQQARSDGYKTSKGTIEGIETAKDIISYKKEDEFYRGPYEKVEDRLYREIYNAVDLSLNNLYKLIESFADSFALPHNSSEIKDLLLRGSNRVEYFCKWYSDRYIDIYYDLIRNMVERSRWNISIDFNKRSESKKNNLRYRQLPVTADKNKPYRVHILGIDEKRAFYITNPDKSSQFLPQMPEAADQSIKIFRSDDMNYAYPGNLQWIEYSKSTNNIRYNSNGGSPYIQPIYFTDKIYFVRIKFTQNDMVDKRLAGVEELILMVCRQNGELHVALPIIINDMLNNKTMIKQDLYNLLYTYSNLDYNNLMIKHLIGNNAMLLGMFLGARQVSI